MSLSAFMERIRADIVNIQAKGYLVTHMVCCDTGYEVLDKALLKEAHPDGQRGPVKLFDRPVRVHGRMPKGHIWYVCKGGKE